MMRPRLNFSDQDAIRDKWKKFIPFSLAMAIAKSGTCLPGQVKTAEPKKLDVAVVCS
jgi:hypothetical protein